MSNSSKIKKRMKSNLRMQDALAYDKEIERDFTWVKTVFAHVLLLMVLLLLCMATPWMVVGSIAYEGLLLCLIVCRIRGIETRFDKLLTWAALIPVFGMAVMLFRYEIFELYPIHMGIAAFAALFVCILISKIDVDYWSKLKCVALVLIIGISHFAQILMLNAALPARSAEKVTFTAKSQDVLRGNKILFPSLEIQLTDEHGHELYVGVSEGYCKTDFTGKQYEITEYVGGLGMTYTNHAKGQIKGVIKATEPISEDYHVLYWDEYDE